MDIKKRFPDYLDFVTEGGVRVYRSATVIDDGKSAFCQCRRALDSHRGVVLSSNYEYPGRYSRWDIGFIDPILSLTACGRQVHISALNVRGDILIPAIARALEGSEWLADLRRLESSLAITVHEPSSFFTEEERIKQPTAFSVVRAIVSFFANPACPHLGLYGAFGYDLAFQFNPIKYRIARPKSQRDFVLYVPDNILVYDHYADEAINFHYEFEMDGMSTVGLKGGGDIVEFRFAEREPQASDHTPDEYADVVRKAITYFARGDLFEAVPSQSFFKRCVTTPSKISSTLARINPAPYGFLINLGEGEYLVGASPEMFVRVTGNRIETCPISGTVSRGVDAISDAEQVRALLNSTKDEAELTMCSDVDRNDKSRVCQPGSVRVIGRRQIEMYSRLIHTVDHIEGILANGFDALDGFLSHTWAVTVTGAPKRRAMQFIEEHERSVRAWYGGAVGIVHFNGDLNTGLTLRTIRVKDGIAEVRAGATLLADSDPVEEERETRLKASAMLESIDRAVAPIDHDTGRIPIDKATSINVLLIDNDDSFVHTLANYLRQHGATVTTLRAPVPIDFLQLYKADLVVLSPGPGCPADFDLNRTIAETRRHGIYLFGVCLGLQGICEYFGGKLRQLRTPMHGKSSIINISGGSLFDRIPTSITVGRYHSLVVEPETLPACLAITARASDGTIMAVEHENEPISAVQFHPESIMALGEEVGLKIIENVLRLAMRHKLSKTANGNRSLTIKSDAPL